MNRDSIISVYSDARAEYTKQLCVFLVPSYFQFFTELLEKAKQSTEQKRSLWQFQTYLNEIHDWNMEKVNNEIHIINTNCGCDYLEDLLTAVFIAHTKVLTAIRLSSNNKKVEINIPKVEHFLFKVLCETSKLLWSSTYLFRDGISGIEKQQNYRNIEQLINDGILQAVRSLVPVKSILRDFVNNDVDDEDDIKNTKDTMDTDTTETTETVSQELPALHIQKEPEVKEVKEPEVKEVKEPEVKEVKEPEVKEVKEVKEPEVKEVKEVKEPEVKESLKTNNTQTIIINDKPSVRFGEFNTVFDSENPNDSDMIYESQEEVPDLQILEEIGAPLSGIDFDNLNEESSKCLDINEYEVLM